ncbi:hypothetical protein [Achromobacter insuavis]|uniref:hypothetical protein n=1 Tax=Achromobacter insuavis TaxID=1287735 RepID=UPI001F14364B|nr:hypothetical protein [Achromobacter insuavis]
MKQSDLNHLRRLLGWVRCDIGQDPAGQQQTVIDIAGKLGIDSIDVDAKARLVEGYRRAEAVPVYVRDAVKALEKAVAAAGRGPGAETARATAETLANTGFDPGATAGRAPAAEPLQNRLDAAAWPVACRDTPAAPPTPRRDGAGGAPECGHLPSTRGVQVKPASAGQAESCRPAINLQVMQEALRLMPSDEARRVAREAEAMSGKVPPEQYVGAGAVTVIAKLRAVVADERAAFEADYAKAWNAAYDNKTNHTAADVAKLREGDGYGEDMGYLKGRWDGWQARAALAATGAPEGEAC